MGTCKKPGMVLPMVGVLAAISHLRNMLCFLLLSIKSLIQPWQQSLVQLSFLPKYAP